MPSPEHEALVDLLRFRPETACRLVTDALGVPLPRGRLVTVGDSNLSQLAPPQFFADLVVRVVDDADRTTFALVVEAQLRPDARKRFAWPAYVANARVIWQCPSTVAVVAPDPAVAEWAAESIPLGPGGVFTPLVLGPDAIPRVTDVNAARAAPALAVLSALAHGRAPDGLPTVLAGAIAADAVAAEDANRAAVYYDLVTGRLDAAALKALERMMGLENYRFQSEFARKYFGLGKAEGHVEGEAEGQAKAMLTVLDARGWTVPDDRRAEILACADPERLATWLRRAVTADRLEDVFRDDA